MIRHSKPGCVQDLPGFDTKSRVFQIENPSFSEYQIMLRNLFRNFEIFCSPKLFTWKWSQSFALPWPSSEGIWAGWAAGKRYLPLLEFFWGLAYFKAETITAVLNFMLAGSTNENWIADQSFPELRLAEMGQLSGCAVWDFRGLSILTSENITPYSLPGFCIARWFFPYFFLCYIWSWTPHILGFRDLFCLLSVIFTINFKPTNLGFEGQQSHSHSFILRKT